MIPPVTMPAMRAPEVELISAGGLWVWLSWSRGLGGGKKPEPPPCPAGIVGSGASVSVRNVGHTLETASVKK